MTLAEPALWAAVGAGAALAGLLPGLHPNVAAALVLAAPAAPPGAAPLLLAAAAGHLFGALAGAAFVGTADPDAAALPPEGREAAELACLGAFLGLAFALPLAAAARYLLGAPGRLYSVVYEAQGALVALAALLPCLLERPRPRGPLAALLVLAAAGALGAGAFRLGAASPLGVPASPLLPLLAGLFAAPALAALARRAGRPPAAPAAPHWGDALRVALLGALGGSVLGLLPGVTAGHPTALLRRLLRPHRDDARVLAGAVAGAGLAFALLVALALGPARSGALAAAVVVEPAAEWRAAAPSPEAARWAAATLAGAGAGCLAALAAAARLPRWLPRLPRRALAGGLLALLAGVVLLLNGTVGLLVLAAAAAVGALPAALGVGRLHLMGAILVPVAWRLLA